MNQEAASGHANIPDGVLDADCLAGKNASAPRFVSGDGQRVLTRPVCRRTEYRAGFSGGLYTISRSRRLTSAATRRVIRPFAR